VRRNPHDPENSFKSCSILDGASDPTARKIASALRGATGWQAKPQWHVCRFRAQSAARKTNARRPWSVKLESGTRGCKGIPMERRKVEATTASPAV